ncbi:helix-turn-helix transcriptional regulator [Nocardia sp. NBC_01329]|uniref:helix-turn-helix transcriptional regulator n=1 Tax=Nocardia sp. NBC_01329 TaxID=2903594 RepID=UPI002E12E87E|nr:AraC family transcriptional regulator [Nocardia sp. NBC_01329]
MRSLVFDSEDLGATEEFLNDAYTHMEIGNDSPRSVRTRIRRDMLGPVSLDRLDLGFDMAYDADPLNKVCLVTVHSGAVEENYHNTGQNVFTPGDSGLLTPHDLPFSGVVRSSRYDITMFEPELLDRLAATNGSTRPVRISGRRPVSPTANRQLTAVITHLQRVATDPATVGSPLLAATGADYLAATVLATMPTTAVTEPAATDRRDAHPETVRRAVAYLESHLHEDVTITEVAAAAFVTPRALQLAFRRHLGTTPLRYRRRLRLAGAHEDLRAARAGDGQTVATIAYRWGFTHPGRFAIAYRNHYGRPPSEVLHA